MHKIIIMKIDSKELLAELECITQINKEAAKQFLNLNEQQLNFKTTSDSWSILECLEHLNLYSAFYLPEISRHLSTSTPKATTKFKSGLWGNYLVNMVIPGECSKKMKTFASMNPSNSKLRKEVITKFIETQNELLQLMGTAKSADLNKAGIAVTFTKLIRLKLGDALRFMAYHNKRHVVQAQRINSGS